MSNEEIKEKLPTELVVLWNLWTVFYRFMNLNYENIKLLRIKKIILLRWYHEFTMPAF